MRFIKEHEKYFDLQHLQEGLLFLNVFDGKKHLQLESDLSRLKSVEILLEEFSILKVKVYHSSWLLRFDDFDLVLSPEAQKPIKDKDKDVSLSSAFYCKYKFKVFAYKYQAFKNIKNKLIHSKLQMHKKAELTLAQTILAESAKINRKDSCYNLLLNNCAEFMADNFFKSLGKRKPLWSLSYLFADRLVSLFKRH